MPVRHETSLERLKEAFRFCECKGSLDAALNFPALTIALKNLAECIEARKPKPRYDFKRAIAGDFDD